MFPVNVAPDMSMYRLLRSQGYDPAYAIAEFIDNSLQAHLSNSVANEFATLKIDLHFFSNDFEKTDFKNSLVIKDSGPGISKDRLINAMKPAKPPPEKGLSEFGIGMKAAAVWFSDAWQLSTVPIGEGKKYLMAFNYEDLIKTNKEVVNVQDIDCEESSGTEISLLGLRKPIDREKFKAITNDLRELYQKFTAGPDPILELTAYFDQTPTLLKFETVREILEVPVFKNVGDKVYAIGENKSWAVPISMLFNGVKVTGYICLLTEGSYIANPGMVMFRHGRVIQGINSKPYLPAQLFQTSNKYERQRVYAELLADDLPVTYTKNKFEIDEVAFAERLRSVPGVLELLKQAKEYRVRATPISVATESEILGLKTTTQINPSESNNNAESKNNPESKTSTKPKNKKTEANSASNLDPFETLLKTIRSKANSVVLQSLIDECNWQKSFNREIGTALALRTVLELGVMDKIRRDFSAEYPKIAHLGIKALLNYMNNNINVFFDPRKDFHIIKCVQSSSSGTQPDVVLLNNIAHGHYRPNFPELKRFVANLEVLFMWAFS